MNKLAERLKSVFEDVVGEDMRALGERAWQAVADDVVFGACLPGRRVCGREEKQQRQTVDGYEVWPYQVKLKVRESCELDEVGCRKAELSLEERVARLEAVVLTGSVARKEGVVSKAALENPDWQDAPQFVTSEVNQKDVDSPALPEGLPELPPVPEGYDRWVYRGMGWSSDDALFAVSFDGDWEGWAVARDRQAHGERKLHYIEAVKDSTKGAPVNDSVNHPKHYTSHPSGVEAIEISQSMSFCLGNEFKYLFRCGYKGDPLEDLKKARWYLQRALDRNEAPAPKRGPNENLVLLHERRYTGWMTGCMLVLFEGDIAGALERVEKMISIELHK